MERDRNSHRNGASFIARIFTSDVYCFPIRRVGGFGQKPHFPRKEKGMNYRYPMRRYYALLILTFWGTVGIMADMGAIPPISLRAFVLVALAIWFACGIHIVDQRYRIPWMWFGRCMWPMGPYFGWMEPIFGSYYEFGRLSIQDDTPEFTIENGRTKNGAPVRLRIVVSMSIDAARVRDFVLKSKTGVSGVLRKIESAINVVLGQMRYQEIKEDLPEISKKVVDLLFDPKYKDTIAGWGARVTSIGFNDFDITDDKIRESFAKIARAEADVEAERVIMEKLGEIAEKYKIPLWTLRQALLVYQTATDSVGSIIPIPTNLVDAFQNLPPDALKKIGTTATGLRGETAPDETVPRAHT